MADLLEYLPDFYRGIRDFVELAETEGLELAAAVESADRLLNNQFVETADEQSIRRRELQIGIRAEPSTETMEFRRRRLINRYSTKPPFTIRYLQQRLDYLVGSGLTIASADVPLSILTVTATIDNASLFHEVHHTLETIKPANLVYQQQTALADKLELEERISSRTLNRNTRLSTTWRLGVTPLADVGPEVIIA
ncbi:MAG: phage portal protein [Paenibacillaceae bacterium]|jgi:hypothetical protein|nr:phage portal protein [Paenibacillaceae bacterium]